MKYCPLCRSDLSNNIIDGKTHLSCSSTNCDYVFWDNPVPVVAAIVEHNGDIIIANNQAWPKSVYSIITGFVERDESPDSAVTREVKEELNLLTIGQKFIGFYPFKAMNQLIIAYYVIAEGDVRINEELSSFRRIPIHEIQNYDFGRLTIASQIIREAF